MKKKIALLMACVMAFGIAVGGTLAWLTDKTGDVVNTFTPSNISITLDETKPVDKTAKMVPGFTIEKDPKVTVLANSEACYLFVKIAETDNFDNFMTYGIAGGWTELTEGSGIYWREVDASAENQEFGVLLNDQVTVLDTVTKGMMTENFTQPTLTFTAYASQMYTGKAAPNDKFTPAQAWENIAG